MKILIIRHAAPDYANDSITEKGHREAEILSRRLAKLDIKEFYVSKLGRARDTLAYTLEKLNKEAIVCDWLKEFPIVINKPNEAKSCAWNWRPLDWTADDRYYSMNEWATTSVMLEGKAQTEYDNVTTEFDKLLKKHGYERENRYYKAVSPNKDTIVLVCHFGVECVLLSHLLGIPPMLLWHGFCAAPSSVTTLVTEEVEKGIAYFRASSLGDVSHLYAENEEPLYVSYSCETYDDFS